MKVISGCGVTANIPVLGTGDSGFESRHPDNLAFTRVGGISLVVELQFSKL